MDFYTEEIVRMLGVLSHGAIRRIYNLVKRLYEKEQGI